LAVTSEEGGLQEGYRYTATINYTKGNFTWRLGGAIDSRPSALPRRLSFDEAAHRKGSNNLATVVSDLDRRCVHEVLDGRSKRLLERYLGSLSEEQRSRCAVPASANDGQP
jgi:hypothetical protein